MHGAVPRHVDEPDEFLFVPRAHPAQTVLAYLCPPVVVIQDLVAEPLRMQDADLGVAEVPRHL